MKSFWIFSCMDRRSLVSTKIGKIKSTIKFSKFSKRFTDTLFWPFIEQRTLNEKISVKDYMYMCVQHLNASVLWLVPVLCPVSCRFYSFVVLYLYDIFGIYENICLRNVNQYYRKKEIKIWFFFMKIEIFF